MQDEEKMIQEILQHLDEETQFGVHRMSVNMDSLAEQEKEVSHKCCVAYGRPANETVGLLDMYTDLTVDMPDSDRRFSAQAKK